MFLVRVIDKKRYGTHSNLAATSCFTTWRDAVLARPRRCRPDSVGSGTSGLGGSASRLGENWTTGGGVCVETGSGGHKRRRGVTFARRKAAAAERAVSWYQARPKEATASVGYTRTPAEIIGRAQTTGPSMGPCVHACCTGRGLCCASEADAVTVWIDELARDDAAVFGAHPSKRLSNFLVITKSTPLITEFHHRLATLLLLRIKRLRPAPCRERIWRACRESSERIRAGGSWKAVIRRPHIELLVLRALVVRRRATTRHFDYAGLRRHVTLPNSVLWRVLSYWRARRSRGLARRPRRTSSSLISQC